MKLLIAAAEAELMEKLKETRTIDEEKVEDESTTRMEKSQGGKSSLGKDDKIMSSREIITNTSTDWEDDPELEDPHSPEEDPQESYSLQVHL